MLPDYILVAGSSPIASSAKRSSWSQAQRSPRLSLSCFESSLAPLGNMLSANLIPSPLI